MNSKQKETKRLIFEEPTSATVKYSDAVKLMESLGGELRKKKGSKRFLYFPEGGQMIHFHEPHGKGKELCKEAVEDFRDVIKQIDNAKKKDSS